MLEWHSVGYFVAENSFWRLSEEEMNKTASRNGETNKVVFGILLAFAVGSLFGLVVLGWGIYPVNWTDASALQAAP